eukprot:snap_masked-scaffold_45-processed-gene-1.47-mRNA-1 protein AED:1.00 eAED:1.00 QI:0/0/0/0/1/1/2/0/390
MSLAYGKRRISKLVENLPKDIHILIEECSDPIKVEETLINGVFDRTLEMVQSVEEKIKSQIIKLWEKLSISFVGRKHIIDKELIDFCIQREKSFEFSILASFLSKVISSYQISNSLDKELMTKIMIICITKLKDKDESDKMSSLNLLSNLSSIRQFSSLALDNKIDLISILSSYSQDLFSCKFNIKYKLVTNILWNTSENFDIKTEILNQDILIKLLFLCILFDLPDYEQVVANALGVLANLAILKGGKYLFNDNDSIIKKLISLSSVEFQAIQLNSENLLKSIAEVPDIRKDVVKFIMQSREEKLALRVFGVSIVREVVDLLDITDELRVKEGCVLFLSWICKEEKGVNALNISFKPKNRIEKILKEKNNENINDIANKILEVLNRVKT